MKPIYFSQARKTSKGTNGNADLNYWTDETQCVSCWKPTIRERFSILFNGRVWLGVKSGNTQPPVFISGKPIFSKVKKSTFQRLRWWFEDLCFKLSNIKVRKNEAE